MDMGGIPSLLSLAASEDVEVRRECAAALRNLSLSEHCKVAIVREGGMEILMDMLHSPDIEICHQASGVVANLAEATENQGLLVDKGALQHIKFVMRSKSIDIQREAARALANISADYAYAPAIVASGALLSMVASLSSPDFLCQRYAVMGVGNLATNQANQKKIMAEGALPPILSLARFENGDLESQRYAALALTNLSATKANHSVMMETGTMRLMRMLLDHLDVEIRNTCIFSIANFSANPNNHPHVLKEGCLSKLVEFLSSPDKNTQLRSVAALRGLSTDSDIRLDIVDAGALDPLLKLSKSDDVEVQMETLACLCNLSLCGCIGDSPLSFLDAVDMAALVAFLCSADSTYRLFGAVTIGNIASNLHLQDAVIRGGALGPLVTVGNAADLETQRCIAYALCNLAADPARRVELVKEGGLPAIISMACSEDQNDQRAAVSTLRGICAIPENRRPVMLAAVSDALTLGTRAIDVEVRVETAQTFCALSINDENKIDMANDNQIIGNLVQLLKEKDYRCLRQALGALANISERHETHGQLRHNLVHNVILDHISHSDIATVREMVRCLSNLTALHENQPPIISGGGIATLQIACEHNDAMVARFGAVGLMNLATQRENHEDMIREKCLEQLIALASGESRKWNLLDDLGNPLSTSEADPMQVQTPRSLGDYAFIQLYGFDRDARRYAVLALGV